MEITDHQTLQWVETPTIHKLRIALDRMEAAGVTASTPLRITELANYPGVIAVRPAI